MRAEKMEFYEKAKRAMKDLEEIELFFNWEQRITLEKAKHLVSEFIQENNN